MKWSIFFILLFTVPSKEWKLEKNVDGIKAFTLDIGKPFKKLKITAPFKASLDKVFAYYFQVSKQSTWMEDIQKSELLKKESDNVWYTRYEIKFPFPYKNRDIVYKMVKTVTENEILVSYTNAASYIPLNNDFVRMTVSEGYWKFTKTGENSSTIETCSYNETAGVPGWMANLFMIEGPTKTMANLRAKVEGK